MNGRFDADSTFLVLLFGNCAKRFGYVKRPKFVAFCYTMLQKIIFTVWHNACFYVLRRRKPKNAERMNLLTIHWTDGRQTHHTIDAGYTRTVAYARSWLDTADVQAVELRTTQGAYPWYRADKLQQPTNGQ
jgi:hypothetical protein